MMTVLAKVRGALALSMALMTATPALADLNVHGSGTVGRGIVLPNQEAIEQAAGFALNIVTNGSGNGLLDLAVGRADVAMISAPVEVEAEKLNAETPGAIDVAAMQTHQIGSSDLFFVVHPDNPVQSITEDQMRGILTGEIGNWSELGGPDAQIVVVAEAPGGGSRSVVESMFIGEQGYGSATREVRDLVNVARIVSQLPTAVGYANIASLDQSLMNVVEGLVVSQPLSLVTIGEPTPDMQSLIEAVRSLQ